MVIHRKLVLFSLAFTVFIIGPAFFSKPFDPFPLMRNGDVFDVLTPFVIIPLYWLLYQANREPPPGQIENLAFLVFTGMWVEGQGMHLSANSIGHLLRESADSDAYRLTFFYDEILSHYLWHLGMVGMVVLLVYREWKNAHSAEHRVRGGWWVGAGAVLHGLIYFIIIVEGGTTPLGVPFALLAVLFGLTRGRSLRKQRPMMNFFFIAFLMATILFAGWGVYWGGFPQFTEVGIIG
jgi:hypothetical protein